MHFARIMGEANAERMLGKEGWKPIAHEAKEVGLVKEVVPHDRLLDRLVPPKMGSTISILGFSGQDFVKIPGFSGSGLASIFNPGIVGIFRNWLFYDIAGQIFYVRGFASYFYDSRGK